MMMPFGGSFNPAHFCTDNGGHEWLRCCAQDILVLFDDRQIQLYGTGVKMVQGSFQQILDPAQAGVSY